MIPFTNGKFMFIKTGATRVANFVNKGYFTHPNKNLAFFNSEVDLYANAVLVFSKDGFIANNSKFYKYR